MKKNILISLLAPPRLLQTKKLFALIYNDKINCSYVTKNVKARTEMLTEHWRFALFKGK
jgi:hypothetical protein